MDPEGSWKFLKVPEGSGKFLKVQRSFEGSRRFREDPDGS